MFASSLFKGAALSLAFAATQAGKVAAQDTTKTSSFRSAWSAVTARSSATFSAIQSRPQGVLGDNIGLGYGVNGTYLLRLDNSGIWSIRADVGVARYGNESHESPFSESVGGRVRVAVSTANYVVPMSVGTQLALPRGVVRPYVNAGIGGIGFFTESSVSGADQGEVIAASTNQSSMTASWSVGGGANVPITLGRIPVAFDAGVQYARGGNARYLAPGSVADLPGSQVSITPLYSNTRLMVVHIGARIGR